MSDARGAAICVFWLEIERGWGQCPNGCSLHLTKEDAEEYIRTYQRSFAPPVGDLYGPHVYDIPGEPHLVSVPMELHRRIEMHKAAGEPGLRLMRLEKADIRVWK